MTHLNLANLGALQPPATHIKTDDDVDTWKRTSGFRAYALFVRRLNEAVVGRDLVDDPPPPCDVSTRALRTHLR